MFKFIRNIFIFLAFIFSVTSCLRSIYGIKKYDNPSKVQMDKYALKWGLDTSFNYLSIDSTQYMLLVNSKIVDTNILHDIKQPLHWQFYDTLGYLNCFVPNCNVGGFPNLKWDRKVFVSAYPPTNSDCFSEEIISLKELIKSSTGEHKSLTLGKTYVVVFWSVLMGRQSKISIKKLDTYLKKYPQNNREIIFVNVDNLFL